MRMDFGSDISKTPVDVIICFVQKRVRERIKIIISI